jgi:hypothetical protein
MNFFVTIEWANILNTMKYNVQVHFKQAPIKIYKFKITFEHKLNELQSF